MNTFEVIGDLPARQNDIFGIFRTIPVGTTIEIETDAVTHTCFFIEMGLRFYAIGSVSSLVNQGKIKEKP